MSVMSFFKRNNTWYIQLGRGKAISLKTNDKAKATALCKHIGKQLLVDTHRQASGTLHLQASPDGLWPNCLRLAPGSIHPLVNPWIPALGLNKTAEHTYIIDK
ncbi:MAG: hypothetical protein EPN22_13665 [Nitrospirae bacterium]|nr:MAG: hypothetical protein EPN22_13665 [Nitrospirota bacterium]